MSVLFSISLHNSIPLRAICLSFSDDNMLVAYVDMNVQCHNGYYYYSPRSMIEVIEITGSAVALMCE